MARLLFYSDELSPRRWFPSSGLASFGRQFHPRNRKQLGVLQGFVDSFALLNGEGGVGYRKPVA